MNPLLLLKLNHQSLSYQARILLLQNLRRFLQDRNFPKSKIPLSHFRCTLNVDQDSCILNIHYCRIPAIDLTLFETEEEAAERKKFEEEARILRYEKFKLSLLDQLITTKIE